MTATVSSGRVVPTLEGELRPALPRLVLAGVAIVCLVATVVLTRRGPDAACPGRAFSHPGSRWRRPSRSRAASWTTRGGRALWTASLAIDVAGDALRPGLGVSPAHFAERYALIVIIALGESIVAIGLTADELTEDRVYALAVAVSFAGAAAAWWAYFDFVQLAAERALHRAGEATRGPMARDVFTFFHYPIVLGIIFLAVAAKKTLAGPTEPLSEGGRAALGVGMGLFILGFVLIRLRVIRRVAWERTGAALVVVAAVLLLDDADTLVHLALAVVTLAVALAVEAVRLPGAP